MPLLTMLAAAALSPPAIAYHEHLLSPATAALLHLPIYDGRALLADLDRAGIARGVVLSMAYTYGDERKQVPDPDAATRAENDWTAGQIAAAQGRLIGFCGVNPLRAAAAAEIRRCAALPGMVGLKLHFGNSGVSLRDPAKRRLMVDIFALADRLRMPIVVHLRSRTDGPYGREDAQAFLDALLPAAPHVVVQVAHLAGAGGMPNETVAAFEVFADAIVRKDPRVHRLMFDMTSAIMPDSSDAEARRVADAIRRVGPSRVLFGTDLPVGGNPAPREAWQLFTARVPLDARAFAIIAANRAAYVPAGWR